MSGLTYSQKNRSILEQSGQIQMGDHIVALYEEEEEIIEYVVSYILGALDRNERCIYVKGAHSAERVLERVHRLRPTGSSSGDLVVLSNSDAYAKDGTFLPDRMIDLLKAKCDEAVAEGYEGIAVTGEISWVLDYRDGKDLIIEYEWKLNERLFDAYPASALCRYNMREFSDEMIINIIQLHPFILYKHTIHENPFYLPPEGYKNQEVATYQVKMWLENIQYFTSEKGRFQETIQKRERELGELSKQMTEGLIMTMIEMLSIHDGYTNVHSQDVAKLAVRFGDYLGLSREQVMQLHYAGLVHDIGKTLIPSEILNKSTRLSEEEFAIVKKHPAHGANALQKTPNLTPLAKIVRFHHERVDGKGYPDGLAASEIPYMSRILMIVDAYDAMISHRPYRAAMSRAEAQAELEKHAGTQFDANLVSSFLAMINGEKSMSKILPFHKN